MFRTLVIRSHAAIAFLTLLLCSPMLFAVHRVGFGEGSDKAYLRTTIRQSTKIGIAAGTYVTNGPISNVNWNSVGPVGTRFGTSRSSGKLNAFAIDPTNANVLYVGGGDGTGNETQTSAGIFGSTDRGASWHALNNGMVDAKGFVDSRVQDLSIDPTVPSTLLAATSNALYRSTDSGNHWTRTDATGRSTQFARVGALVYANTASGISVSSDGGATWRASLVAQGVVALSSDAYGTHAGTVAYAGTTSGTIYKLGNGAWLQVGKTDFGVHRLAIDPFATETVYASTLSDTYGVFGQTLNGSIDGGATWRAIYWQSPSTVGLGVQAIAFSTVTPHRLFIGGNDYSGIFYANGDGSTNPHWTLGANTDGVDRRQIWTLPNGNDDQCYVTTDQGLFVADHCSNKNAPIQPGLTGTIADYLVDGFGVGSNGQELVAVLRDYSAAGSSDGGKTWNLLPLGANGVAKINPSNDAVCYLATPILSISTTGCGAGYWMMTSSVPIYEYWPDGLITFDPANSKHLYVVLSQFQAPGGVYESRDSGFTFAPTAWSFPGILTLAIDPNNNQHMVESVVRTGVNSATPGIEVTVDGGAHWIDAAGVPSTVVGWNFAIDPTDSNIVLAISPAGVYKSVDGGRTFTANFVVGADFRADSIAFNPAPLPGVVPIAVFTTFDGLYATSDLGETWQRIDQNSVSHRFTQVQWRQGYLYAGTSGQGIIVSATPLQDAAPPKAPIALPVRTTIGINTYDEDVWPAFNGGAPSSVAVATSPSHGTVRANGTRFSYTPDPGFLGTDSFTYAAINAGGTSAPATITIDVLRHGQVTAVDDTCLDAQGHTVQGLTYVGEMMTWECSHNNPWQAWTFLDDGTIRQGGRCLDASEVNFIFLGPCYGSESQQWKVKDKAIIANSGLCLDAQLPVKIAKCSGSPQQQWNVPWHSTVALNQHGLTGVWYDPTTSGQGLLIETYKDLVAPGQGYIAAGWYTFDVASSGGQRWYTLQGAANSGVVSSDLGIYTAVGGNFNSVPKVSASQVGTATLSFSSCTTGLLSYSFNDGRAGKIPLRRIDPNITCSLAGDNGNAAQNYLLSGAWYDPNTSGQGFIFDVNPAINLLSAAWYTYAPNGQSIGSGMSQRWYTIQDNAFLPGTTSEADIPIYETVGGVFNSGQVKVGTPVGKAKLNIRSCTAMDLSYNFTTGTNAGQTGTIQLTRVVGAPSGCAVP